MFSPFDLVKQVTESINIMIWCETQIYGLLNIVPPRHWYGEWEYSPQYTLWKHMARRYKLQSFLGKYHMYSDAFIGFDKPIYVEYDNKGVLLSRMQVIKLIKIREIHAYRKYLMDMPNPTPNGENDDQKSFIRST